VLASPLTGLLGPVASYDLLLRLVLVVSTTTAYLALRRVGLSWMAAGLGGLVYGFSP